MSSGGVVVEQQQSSWLVQRLQASAGPQSFVAVMDWLLNDPAYGYYGSGQVRFGSGGDFVTAPSQGPVFAELLARQLRPCLDALAAESGPLTLIEWGPGDGQLMRDLIAGIGAESPAWLDRLELVLVESSPALQARQRQTLAGSAVPVHWYSPQQLAAEPRRGLIVAHELLDALPVQRFGLQNGNWHEWLVSLDGQQQPCWQVGAGLAPAVLEQLEQLGLPPGGGGRPDGWSSEWCPALGPWLEQARACLRQGWLLAIDYAMPASRYYAPSRDGGTLLACREQRTSTELLRDPGRMDLTAHVCTTLVEQLAAAAGWRWQGAALQGEVLLQLGLAQEITALSEPGPLALADRLSRREQLLRLVDPHLLGGFWWLLLESDSATPPQRPACPPAWWPS